MEGCTNSFDGPTGYGCATLTASKAGAIVVSGTLAEGSAFSASAVLSKEGVWPLYVPLYSGRGLILSWITNDVGKLSGDATWCRPNFRGTYYSQGFTNCASVSGYSYVPPAGNRVINVTNATLALSGAGTNAPIVNYVALSARNTVTSTNKAVLTIRTATGAFSGSVVDPVTKKKVPFYGVVNQRENAGYGYYLESNLGGEVYFGQ